jgi:hypothetical protein
MEQATDMQRVVYMTLLTCPITVDSLVDILEPANKGDPPSSCVLAFIEDHVGLLVTRLIHLLQFISGFS